MDNEDYVLDKDLLKEINTHGVDSSNVKQVADYFETIYHRIITYKNLKEIASNMLESGLSLDDILNGIYDKDIYMYTTEEVVTKEEVEEEYKIHKKAEKYFQKKEKLRIKKIKMARDVIVIALSGLGLIIAYKDISKTFKNKNERQENREALAAITGLEENSIAGHSRETISGRYDGGVKVNIYDASVIANDIIKGCHKDSNLFDYYLFDTFYEISKSKSTIAPLSLFDDVLEELQFKLEEDGELVELYNRISGCNTFLDYLYVRGFVPPTDEDYYDIGEDIAKYYVLSLAGEKSPIDRLPSESQKRLAKLINAFLSQKYEDVLKNEFSDDIAALLGEGARYND